uniref:Coiled-coil and C2 domain-containing protein 1B n=1 Tax=Sphaeramia orbicularis TaxID=375764 RepID=A0A672YHL1_9TELE
MRYISSVHLPFKNMVLRLIFTYLRILFSFMCVEPQAELNEVLEDDEGQTSAPSPPAMTPPAAPSGASGLEAQLAERIEMYKTAISNAKAAGETSKVRRYDRGLKTLQSMLISVRKGKPINEEEIPPPVAVGGKPSVTAVSKTAEEQNVPQPTLMPCPPTNQKPLREAAPPTPNSKPVHLTPPQRTSAAVTPDTPAISPLTPMTKILSHYSPICVFSRISEEKQAVLTRQREYKLAAINAKQSGDIDQAKQHYLIAKVKERKLDVLVEALDRGEPIDSRSVPPPPGEAVAEHRAPPPSQSSSKPTAAAAPAPTQVATSDLSPPSTVAEALQQRMDIYKSAAEGAKSKGDDRKARMHQRIVKQYQDAIRAHKAGRPVNLSDLPVPPGCPPLQGSEGGQQNFMGVLETAMKIANQDADAEDEDEDALREAAKQQVDFLLLRRQAFLRAALHSKQMKDMAGAAQHLRHAKGLDPMVTAAKSGLPVDITKVRNTTCSIKEVIYRSPHYRHVCVDLLLREQLNKCLRNSQQFTEMGNVVEALKCERLVEECMKNIEILKNAYTKGHPVPKCRTEERTFNTFKIYPNLTPNDLILYIIRGINLPAPSGVSPNDLDASVKFEFPFPSSEEAQRDKTGTVKGTNSPEFKEQFKLSINRNQRSFKRVVQSKGIKFEVIHKGGLFKTDKVVGTAQLKLEALENHCDFREIIEVMDGRKATGGKLEVRVKLREPLSGVDLQSVTEKWLVLDPVSPLSPPERQKERVSRITYKLHSFSLLNYDRERLERKITEYRKNRRDPPSDLIHQHKEVIHRLQWQKAQLERASPALLSGNTPSIHLHDAAKDALGRLKLVENEVRGFM